MAGVVTVEEPVPRALEKVLRRAVLEHATREQRRHYAPVLHVGLPDRPSRRFEAADGETLDHSLRVDVIEAMTREPLQRSFVPLIWLTRPGDRADQDCDSEWGAAVRSAGAELGLGLGLVVVTRRSWHDPVSGVGRTWQRLRHRS